jgi:hypothetical protein
MTYVIASLDLNRPQLRQHDVNHLTLENTGALKQKLLQEIVALEKQWQAMDAASAAFDFSMQQTYKEMVHSRKQLFNALSR